jgi:hypothetical protein
MKYNMDYLKEKGAYNETKNVFLSAEYVASNYDKYKYDKFKCIDPYCNEPVFLKKGKKRKTHYCHYKNSNCKTLNNIGGGGEGLSHKQAKIYLSGFLKNRGIIHVTRKCCGNYAKCNEEVETSFKCELCKDNKIELEKNITFKNKTKYLDIAQVNCNDDVVEFYEIYDTSITNENERPSHIKWYEFKANDIGKSILKMIDDRKNYLELECKRFFRCEKCTFDNNKLMKLKLNLKREDMQNQCIRINRKNRKICPLYKYDIRKYVSEKLIDLAKREACYIGYSWDTIKYGSLVLDVRSCDIDPMKYFAIINYYLPLLKYNK